MKVSYSIFIGVLASTVLSLVHGAPSRNYTRSLRKRNVQLDNWAGAAIKAPPDGTTFVTVIGTFVVPTIDPAKNTKGTAVSLWVGLDGYSPKQPPVIQAGVDVEYAADGRMIYRCWTEFLDGSDEGNEPVDTGLDVKGGDTVQVQVTGAAGSEEATAIFTINGVEEAPILFPSTEGKYPKVLGKNIEWVIERLAGTGDKTGGAGTLLNFDTIKFSGCSGSTAKVAASSSPKDGDLIDMAVPGTSTVSAATTLVGNDGLSIKWVTG